MNAVRIALASIPIPESPRQSVALAIDAVRAAGAAGADVVCFPECTIPGYRISRDEMPPPDGAFLDEAWAAIAKAAAAANVGVVLGTERIVDGELRIAALVIDRRGTVDGMQDKVQLDPSEEGTYAPGTGRRVFTAGPMTFGVAICHEGWRYPETVRSAARQGAQVVFHPHFEDGEPGSQPPSSFADPANTFHEKAMLCRAAENTCYFASVNFASPRSRTTSAIVAPDGSVVAWQPYGKPGLLVADLDLSLATGLLASRFKEHTT